jgi:hypothetical protein
MAEEEVRSKEWAARIEELTSRADALKDPEARRVAVDLLQVVMDYHAAAIERMMRIVNESEGGASIAGSIAEDGLAASVLLLHDLHPDGFETRVRRAVDKLRLRLNPRGANLTLLGLDPPGMDSGVVRLRYEPPRNGHVPSARNLIEDGIVEMAPETVEVSIEGLEEQPASNGFVPLQALFAGQAT